MLNSDNIIARTIIIVGWMALTLSWMVIGDIWGLYGMERCNVRKRWYENCKNEHESVRVCAQIREMCNWRDRCAMTLFNKEEWCTIIEFLCTG